MQGDVDSLLVLAKILAVLLGCSEEPGREEHWNTRALCELVCWTPQRSRCTSCDCSYGKMCGPYSKAAEETRKAAPLGCGTTVLTMTVCCCWLRSPLDSRESCHQGAIRRDCRERFNLKQVLQVPVSQRTWLMGADGARAEIVMLKTVRETLLWG